MFKFLRKAAEKLGIIAPTRKIARRSSTPITPVTRPPSRQTVNIVKHITDQFGHANLSNVRRRVRYMTPDERVWTIRATRRDIQNKAKLPGDRYDDDGELLNPWWYK